MHTLKWGAVVALMGTWLVIFVPHTSPAASTHSVVIFKKSPSQRELVIEYIAHRAQQSTTPVRLALDIAECESQFDPLAQNKNSTASGVYQFTKGTWWAYCEGDVFNYKDNIDCFFKLYNRFPSWWECSPS